MSFRTHNHFFLMLLNTQAIVENSGWENNLAKQVRERRIGWCNNVVLSSYSGV